MKINLAVFAAVVWCGFASPSWGQTAPQALASSSSASRSPVLRKVLETEPIGRLADFSPAMAADAFWIGAATNRFTRGSSESLHVRQTLADSPAAEAGFLPGDHLVRYGDLEISDHLSLVQAVNFYGDRRTTVSVVRGRQPMQISIVARAKPTDYQQQVASVRRVAPPLAIPAIQREAVTPSPSLAKAATGRAIVSGPANSAIQPNHVLELDAPPEFAVGDDSKLESVLQQAAPERQPSDFTDQIQERVAAETSADSVSNLTEQTDRRAQAQPEQTAKGQALPEQEKQERKNRTKQKRATEPKKAQNKKRPQQEQQASSARTQDQPAQDVWSGPRLAQAVRRVENASNDLPDGPAKQRILDAFETRTGMTFASAQRQVKQMERQAEKAKKSPEPRDRQAGPPQASSEDQQPRSSEKAVRSTQAQSDRPQRRPDRELSEQERNNEMRRRVRQQESQIREQQDVMEEMRQRIQSQQAELERFKQEFNRLQASVNGRSAASESSSAGAAKKGRKDRQSAEEAEASRESAKGESAVGRSGRRSAERGDRETAELSEQALLRQFQLQREEMQRRREAAERQDRAATDQRPNAPPRESQQRLKDNPPVNVSPAGDQGPSGDLPLGEGVSIDFETRQLLREIVLELQHQQRDRLREVLRQLKQER